MPSLVVQTLCPQPYIAWRNTDYAYYRDLSKLGATEHIEFRHARQLGITLPQNLSAAAEAAMNRIPGGQRPLFSFPWLRVRRLVRVPRALLGDAHVIFTNHALPSGRVHRPLVIEADFCLFGSDASRLKIVERALWLPESAVERASVIVMRTEQSRAAFEARYPRHAHKAQIIPYYMPYLEPAAKDVVRAKWANVEPPRLLFVGLQARRKGIVPLIAALTALRAKGRKFEFTAVTNFRDGVVELPDWVDYRPGLPREEVQALMASTHYFVMPSFEEAYGKVYVEALAAGAVLLAPSHQPLAQFWSRYGVTADPHSVDDLAASLDVLITRPEQFAALGVANSEAFLQTFHHPQVAKRYAQMFRSVAAST